MSGYVKSCGDAVECRNIDFAHTCGARFNTRYVSNFSERQFSGDFETQSPRKPPTVQIVDY